MTISVNIYKLHAQIKNVKADMSVLDINSLDWHRNFGNLLFAKVYQTVAYIAVDEDENGNAVWEKWQVTHSTLNFGILPESL